MVNHNNNNNNNNNIPSLRVGVYYYPWYGDNFHGGIYPRKDLIPHQLPVLGEYDDRQSHVIAQHVQWSQQAGIQIWITSWWGPNDQTDQTLLQTIIPFLETNNKNNANTTTTTSPIQMAVFYETIGRIKKQPAEDGTTTTTYDFSNIQSDIRYLARQYFCHSTTYYRIRGRPVLFVYVTRALYQDDVLGTVIGIMRKTAKEEGYDNLYIVGDQVWSDPPNDPKRYQPFQLLDAVTNYDVYGNLRNEGDLYARQDAVDRYQARQMAWLQATRDSGTPCAFIPSITPGFTKMGGEFMPLSRQLDDSAPHGSLFQALLQNSFRNTDECADHMVMITSWNEWHEDTQIEPVDPADGNTNQPWNVTSGITYHAYGTLYLDILKQEICEYCTGSSSSSSSQPDNDGCFSCLQPTLELEMGVCTSGCSTLSLGGVPCILFLLVGILSVLRTNSLVD